jgi:outer membrane receptor protein involved in Fe transport
VVFAQLTTSDILGTVTDSTGSVVPNANVTLTNVDTQEKRTATSNASGEYVFPLLNPGHYSITVEAPGYATPSQLLAVEAGDRARADFHMTIGSATQTVTVEGQTPLLQTDNATVSSTVTEKAVQDLPLNGRNFVQMVQLVPGANEGLGNGLASGSRPDDRRQSSAFTVNGQDSAANNYLIDGIDNNERIIGTIGVKPSVEGIQEISIQTNSYVPEAGRTSGGVINISTKSGSNTLHGSLYEYFRNDIFDSRNVLSPEATVPKAELRQNQFGGSFGGPIRKNKTFFFGDYEAYRQVSGGTTFTTTVPTLLQYDSINSLNGGQPSDITAAGNLPPVQTYSIDPIVLNYMKLFPKPNAGAAGAVSNNYISNPSKTQDSDTYDARVDQSFNQNNLLTGHFTFNKVITDTPNALPVVNGIAAGGGRLNYSGTGDDQAQQWILHYTHIFNSNLLLDLHAGYTRVNLQSDPLNYGQNLGTSLGFGTNVNFEPLASGLPVVSIGSFPDLGDGYWDPLQYLDSTYEYLGVVNYTRGNHNFKAGVNLIRRQARNIQSKALMGVYTFGLTSDSYAPGTTTSGTTRQTEENNLASALVGAMASSFRYVDLFNPDYRTWEPGGFVQDNWRLNSKLTVTYGLRYDIYTPYTEAHNRISNFNFGQALQSTSATIGSALQVAGVNGVSSTAGIKTDYSNLAPRLGFSYTVSQGLVLRGGYGITYFAGNFGSHASLKNAPFISVYAPTCETPLAYQIQTAANPNLATSIAPACSAAQGQQTTFDQGAPLPAAQTINSPSITFAADDPNLRSALIQQFNLQLERAFGPNVLTIGYVGNIGSHVIELTQDVNIPAPNPGTLTRPLHSLLPNVGYVENVESEGMSNYNGLQASFQRRFSRGLSFDGNYTWAHALSDVLDMSQAGYEGWDTEDPTRIRALEYGNSDDDIRQRMALSLNYEIPFSKGLTGAKKMALGGWQFNTIAAWQTGKSFTINNGANAGGYSNRANPKYNNGADRPNMVKSPKLGSKSNSEFFDVTAFVPQTLGTVGNEPRNPLYGPHFRHVDLSIFKDWTVRKKTTVQFRAESFNLFNTPSFFISNTNSGTVTLGNGAFGAVSQADPNYNPRQIQFALKMLF